MAPGGRRLPVRPLVAVCVALTIMVTVHLYHPVPLPSLALPYAGIGRPTPTPSVVSSFVFDESRYPPPPHPFQEHPEQAPTFDFGVSPVKERGMLVTDAVHYVWPSRAPAEDGEANMGRGAEVEELPYSVYLSIRSALQVLKPHRLYFHYTNLPSGPWWDLVEPFLTLNQVPSPTRVYDHTLEKAAHRADVLRILALQKLGGIYLDLDMFIVRPFDEFMWAPFTMGIEAYPGSGGVAKGLCNAVVISEPGAPFLETWLRSYLEFRHDLYEYNGIIKPWNIARYNHSSIQVVTHEAFFNPTWAEEEIRMVHETADWDWDASGQCAYHAWTSVRPEYIRELNPHDVRKGDTSFRELVRRYMGDEDERVWDAWKGNQH